MDPTARPGLWIVWNDTVLGRVLTCKLLKKKKKRAKRVAVAGLELEVELEAMVERGREGRGRRRIMMTTLWFNVVWWQLCNEVLEIVNVRCAWD